MAWNKLSSHLIRFKNLKTPEKIKKDVIISGVLKKTGVTLQEKEIAFSGSVVFVKAGVSEKNEIFLNKKNILHELRKSFYVEDIK